MGALNTVLIHVLSMNTTYLCSITQHTYRTVCLGPRSGRPVPEPVRTYVSRELRNTGTVHTTAAAASNGITVLLAVARGAHDAVTRWKANLS